MNWKLVYVVHSYAWPIQSTCYMQLHTSEYIVLLCNPEISSLCDPNISSRLHLVIKLTIVVTAHECVVFDQAQSTCSGQELE